MQKQLFCKDWNFQKEGGEPICVELPHDAMIVDRRSAADSDSGEGYYVGGNYIYEKKFTVPIEWAQKYAALQFEGVYRNARVFVNGKSAGGRPYGYIPFFVELNGLLEYGVENTIRVEAENTLPNSRWYPGGGIYRPVWLWLGEKSHFEPEGLRVSTISYSPAKISLSAKHTGDGLVKYEIFEGEALIAEAQGDSAELEIPDAKLWSDEAPFLYRCKATLVNEGETVDKTECLFGIRVIEWSAKGLFVNGKETLLRGGCVHHDNGILGSRSYAKSEERRVKRLKENGFNAIRSAHNPAAKATLEACDKYGVYMMDETWDMWYCHKTKHDYAEWFTDNWEQDVEALVSRDFNHPSVILYSIGNEVGEPGEPKGLAVAKQIIDKLHKLDPSRPVTGGINLMIVNQTAKGNSFYKGDGEMSVGSNDGKEPKMNSTVFNMMVSIAGGMMNKRTNGKKADENTSPVLDALDIAGYNYASGRYPLEAKLHPERVILGSETFPQDLAKNWAMVKEYPYLVGDFMWTSWDYLGETGIGAWVYGNNPGFQKPYPWKMAEAGAFDILGNNGAPVGFARAVWGKLDKPYIGVRPANHMGEKLTKAMWRGTNGLPSWSWKDCEGSKTVVEVFYDAYEAELLLDVGKKKPVKLGKKKIEECTAAFKVKYRPGTLIAVVYDELGRELSRSELKSAAAELRVSVEPEESCARVGDVIYVNVNITDAEGIVESNADAQLKLSLENGELLAFGSACPCTEESYETGCYTSYYGRALAVVKATGGDLKINVSSEKYPDASALIKVDAE